MNCDVYMVLRKFSKHFNLLVETISLHGLYYRLSRFFFLFPFLSLRLLGSSEWHFNKFQVDLLDLIEEKHR